jgi:CubicO group peptidase (beta-lactamase class C family)
MQTGPSCIFDASDTLDACARTIAGLPLQSTPGTAFAYGEEDLQVAGRIAEVVTGKKWEDFFNAAIGVPCGLHAFSYGPTDNPRIGGSVSTDLHDYAALLAMQLNGGMCGSQRVLSGALVAQMQRDATQNLPIVSSPYADGRHYGMGWWIDPGGNGAEVSDSGSSGSVAWIDHARDYAAFLMTNSTWNTGQALWDQVKPLLDQNLGQPCATCAGAALIHPAVGGTQKAPRAAADLARSRRYTGSGTSRARWSAHHCSTTHPGPCVT